MNIHEYQAKEVLKAFGAPVAKGVPVFKAEEASAAVKQLPGPLYVVKSQIHAGGRGKGKFQGLSPDAKGGVRLAKSVEEVAANAKEMLGRVLVTKQTGPAGREVNRLYIEDGADIDRELYLSLLVDRTVGRVAFVVSTEGGMDIETVAAETPDRIVTVAIDPKAGVTAADVAKLNGALRLSGDAAKDGGDQPSHWHEAHSGPTHRLAEDGCIDNITVLATDIGYHMGWRHQTGVMASPDQSARVEVGRAAPSRALPSSAFAPTATTDCAR